MNGTMGFVVWLVIMVAFMYFMVYRPQKKQENAAKVLRNSLTPGDTIETIGGFTGRIVSIKDEDVVFETGADKTKLVVKKWGIRSRTPADEQ
ncbi:MAG: preprotein translocase subunit YajC [Clostridia bacterium]|nr:preprotein translocase subunit YajC [Clostridia bacterium]